MFNLFVGLPSCSVGRHHDLHVKLGRDIYACFTFYINFYHLSKDSTNSLKNFNTRINYFKIHSNDLRSMKEEL